jgi:hypothetical protein
MRRYIFLCVYLISVFYPEKVHAQIIFYDEYANNDPKTLLFSTVNLNMPVAQNEVTFNVNMFPLTKVYNLQLAYSPLPKFSVFGSYYHNKKNKKDERVVVNDQFGKNNAYQTQAGISYKLYQSGDFSSRVIGSEDKNVLQLDLQLFGGTTHDEYLFGDNYSKLYVVPMDGYKIGSNVVLQFLANLIDFRLSLGYSRQVVKTAKIENLSPLYTNIFLDDFKNVNHGINANMQFNFLTKYKIVDISFVNSFIKSKQPNIVGQPYVSISINQNIISYLRASLFKSSNKSTDGQ